MTEIYDIEKKQWLQLTRNFFGTLKLSKIIEKGSHRYIGNGDFVVQANTLRVHKMKRVKTPEPEGDS